MTYDPDPYNNPIRSPDDPATREWGSSGTIIGGLIAIVIIAGMLAYGATKTGTSTATGPNSTVSPPTTTGQR